MGPMLCAAFTVLLTGALGAQQREFDVIIRGGTVIGTGSTRFRADVALKGDRIALVSRVPILPSRGARARDLELFPLETAVYKMTGQSAARLKLRERGVVRAGHFAAVLDAARIADKSTFENPHQYSVGIDYVFANGVAAVDGGKFTDTRAGRVLKRGK